MTANAFHNITQVETNILGGAAFQEEAVIRCPARKLSDTWVGSARK